MSLVLLLALSLSVSPNVEAQDTTYTSTADFDGGTKNDPADGNYGIETSSDNTATATGALELANLEGDTFSLADGDGDTFKWNLVTRNAPTVNQWEVTGGVLATDIACNGCFAANTQGRSFRTAVSISGDIDIRFQIDPITEVGSNTCRIVVLDTATAWWNVAGQDGYIYQRSPCTGGTATLYVYNITNGGAAQIGTATVFTSDPFYLRIARSTNTFTFYYGTDGTAWTTDETTTDPTKPSALFAGAESDDIDTAGDRLDVDYDSYNLASGIVASGGFRTSGNWISSSFTIPDAQRLSQIELTHSSLTAANYIDLVEVRESGGTVLESFVNDITSGTSTILVISGNFDGVLTVRLYLASGGAGTPVLEAVALTYGFDSATGEGGGNRRVSVQCDLSWVTQWITCVDSTNYAGATGIISVGWTVDGKYITSTPLNSKVALPAGDSFINARNGITHEVVMELRLNNGGRQTNTIPVSVDYTPRITIFIGLFGLALGLVFLIGRRALTKSVSFPRLKNPSYRRTAISTEEYPKGWVSYRQKDPEEGRAYRSKVIRKDRRGRAALIAVYELRPATRAERARTGRPRVAILQTVRERMR